MAKKVKAPITTVAEGSGFVLDSDFGIEGVAFRWVNGDARNAMSSWRHWNVVTRDSEIGKEIASKIGHGHSNYSSGNEDSQYFRRGDLVLASADAETVKQYVDGQAKKADDRLRQVVKPGTTLRQTFISAAPDK